MERVMSTRGMAVVLSLLVTAFFAACQDSGPTEVPLDIDAQFAKGGNGGGNGNGGGPGGGGDPPPATPYTLGLTGGMIASDDGQIGTDDGREILFTGQPHFSSDCDADGPGTENLCFFSTLAMAEGVTGLVAHLEDPTANAFPDACRLPRKLTETTAFPLLELLADGPKARLIFSGRVDNRKKTGRLRTDWYERDGTGTRYTYFLISEIGIPQVRNAGVLESLTFTKGVIAMYSSGHGALECDWTGTITVTFSRDDPEPPPPTE